MRKYSSYILFLLLAIFVVILYANGFGPLDRAQQSLNDLLCSVTAEEGVRPHIALVTIDGQAQRDFGQWPWNRDLVADLMAATAAGGPRAMVANIDLSEDLEQDSAGHTGILAGQLSWMKNVVLPYDFTLASFRSNVTSNPEYLFNYSVVVDDPLGLMHDNASPVARKVFLPANRLLETKPYLGFDFVRPDEDRVLRHQPMLVHYEGYYYPSLALIASAAYLGVPTTQIKVIEGEEIQLGSGVTVPINSRSEYFINFPPENSFVTYSAADILSEDFDRSRLKDKLVLIGLDAITDRQVFETPLDPEASRLTIQAAIAENIINENFLRPLTSRAALNMIILLIIGATCAFLLPGVPLLYRFVILGAGLFILVNVNYFMVSSFRMIPDTVYIALELLLFMAASPFLDSSFIRNEDEATESPARRDRTPVVTAARRSDPEEVAKAPVRELHARPSDQEHVKTTVLDTSQSKGDDSKADAVGHDHQALSLDAALDETVAGSPAEEPQYGEILLGGDEPIDGSDEKEPGATPAPEEASETPGVFGEGITLDDEPVEAEAQSPQPAAESQPNITNESSGAVNASQTGGIPSKLGRYEISGTLGKGAMGQVYKGVDPAINRPVALKTIRLDFVNDPEEMAELKERLHREAQAAGKLSHPNIVGIFDVGSEGPLQYIVMEYLEGRTLEDMIKKKTRFNYRIIAEIIIQICSALQYAHEANIVHRDIKPANIMILKDYRVKVMDYGIARVDTSSMTKTGIAMGTPNYISPEQLKGQQSDRRADIFSLGVVMYEMLLGKRPFKGENITSLIYSIINKEPEKPSDVNPQIPLLFDHIIMKALQKDPAQRYQKASEIALDMKDFVESFAAGS